MTTKFLWLAALALGSVRAQTLLNVSYDVSRELFAHYNRLYQSQHPGVEIKQSHAGAAKQALAILQGLPADVVTFNQVSDIDLLAQRGQLLPSHWADRLPQQSSPYYSISVFLVRPGNPKAIRDWDDLIRPDVAIVLPNPKTSGNGRYSYLAALAYAQQRYPQDPAAQQDFLRRLLARVVALDGGSRSATGSFVERQRGDVLLSFEAEALAIQQQLGAGYEIIRPPLTIKAEFPVAWLDANTEAHGTTAAAIDYLRGLYRPEGQRLLAQHFFRPSDPAILAEFGERFPPVQLRTVAEVAGSWPAALGDHFAPGALLDQLQRRP